MHMRIGLVLSALVGAMAATVDVAAQEKFDVQELVGTEFRNVNVAVELNAVTISPNDAGRPTATYTYGDVRCKEYSQQEEALDLLRRNPLKTAAGWVRWLKGKLGAPNVDHIVTLRTRIETVRLIVPEDASTRVLNALTARGVADCSQVV